MKTDSRPATALNIRMEAELLDFITSQAAMHTNGNVSMMLRLIIRQYELNLSKARRKNVR